MKILACLLLSLSIMTGDSIAQKKPVVSPLSGKWIFTASSEMETGNLSEGQLPDLFFPDSARTVSGYTGCNRINGSYEIDGERFLFGPMVSTYKACPDMEMEKFITHFLIRVGFYRIEGDRLYLYDKDDRSRYVVYQRNTLV